MTPLRSLIGVGLLFGALARPQNSLNSIEDTEVAYDCPEEDGFYPDANQCDKYFQCINGTVKEHTCPDGLLFHPERPYPCVYPIEVDCGFRGAIQKAHPSEQCPRQYGLFRTSQDSSDCAGYTNCIQGVAHYIECPESLAFNSRSLLCEWADEVEECDPAGYLGFTCPEEEFGPEEVGTFTTERHSDCTKFFVCLKKEDGTIKPRLQSCPEATVYNYNNRTCTHEVDTVPGCEDAIGAEVLDQYIQREQDERDRIEARLQELRSTLTI